MVSHVLTFDGCQHGLQQPLTSPYFIDQTSEDDRSLKGKSLKSLPPTWLAAETLNSGNPHHDSHCATWQLSVGFRE